ncbi:MDR family MFS transporter [Salinispira pacifica]
MQLSQILGRLDPRRVLTIYTTLSREVKVLFIANVVNSLGVFVLPFLTLLLTVRLGMSPTEAGSVILAASIAAVPGSFAGGKLVDHIGRKPVLVGASLMSAALFLPCAFLGHDRIIALFIVAAQFFWGAVPPAITALVTDITRPDERQAAFSLLYLGHNIGFAVGPLVAGMLFNSHAELLFLGDALTTTASMLLVALLVRDSRPTHDDMVRSALLNPEETPETGGILQVIFARPRLLFFVLAAALLNLVYAQIGFALPLQMNQLFGDAGPSSYGLLMTTNGLVVITLTAPVVAITRRFRPVANMTVVGILYAVGFGMIGLSRSLAMLVVSTIVWTVGEVIGATNIDAFVANNTPASHRGRMNSITPILLRLGFSLSPLFMGFYLEHNPIGSVWLLSGGLAAVAAVVFLLMRIPRRKGNQTEPPAVLPGGRLEETGDDSTRQK